MATMARGRWPHVAWCLAAVLGAGSATANERNLTANDVKGLMFFRDALITAIYESWPGQNDGSQWPPNSNAKSMCGKRRMDNAVGLMGQAMAEGTAGDFIETGVWRGGLSFLVAKQLELADSSRTVYLCDSFEGIPKASKAHNTGPDKDAHTHEILNDNSLERVQDSAKRFRVDPARVEFVQGYFDKTLPALMGDRPDLRFAVVRLDGDTFDSTWAAISALYPRLEPGGFLIVDDYTDWVTCREAIDKYRADHGIVEPMFLVSHRLHEETRGIYWRKAGGKPATSGDTMCPAAWTTNLSPTFLATHRHAKLVAAPGDEIRAPQGHNFIRLGEKKSAAPLYICDHAGLTKGSLPALAGE